MQPRHISIAAEFRPLRRPCRSRRLPLRAQTRCFELPTPPGLTLHPFAAGETRTAAPDAAPDAAPTIHRTHSGQAVLKHG